MFLHIRVLNSSLFELKVYRSSVPVSINRCCGYRKDIFCLLPSLPPSLPPIWLSLGSYFNFLRYASLLKCLSVQFVCLSVLSAPLAAILLGLS